MAVITAKEQLTKLLAGKEAGKDQYVEIPVRLVRAILTGKAKGACERQDKLLAAAEGLRPDQTVHQRADNWIIIAGELS
ncbi:hypothetical protein [Zavarzinella formosa]|uniref:hypothetical protein n=1 Tax=Zavarzinella formosa TaxID=360055 RepID=UPI0002FFE7EC|nr:hypothetical protein [Zavarzinella formosa]